LNFTDTKIGVHEFNKLLELIYEVAQKNKNTIKTMIEFLKRIFGFGPKVDYQELLKKGALIIDVRTKEEYRQGHLKSSVNIPLDTLSTHYSKLKKGKPVIFCCATGRRSGLAKRILKSKGYIEVYNGGSWRRLQNKIN